MTLSDVDAVAEIEKDSFKFPWSRQSLEDECYNPIATCFVVCDDAGTVCGYGGYLKVLDEAYITNVAVKPCERNKGYGAAIIKALTEEAKATDCTAITLEVRESNAQAIKLYEKFGFAFSGIRPKFYPDGENAKIYWLTFRR